MTICKLINDELEVMSNYELLELAPQNYDAVVTELRTNISQIEILQKILDLDKKAIELVDASFKKIYEAGKGLDYYLAKDHKDITDHALVYIGDLNFQEYQKHNEGVTKFPDSLKVVFGTLRALESDISVVDLAHVDLMIDIEGNEYLTEVNILSCYHPVYIHTNPNLKSVNVGDVKGINLIKNNNLQSVSVHSSTSLDASECMALENVSVIYVNQGLCLSNCKKLKNLQLEYVGHDIRFAELPELKLKNIHGFDNKKIYVGTFFFPNKGLCDPEPNDLFGVSRYAFNASEYIKSQILKKFDMTKDNIVINNL